ncbi:MAG: DUF5694 domain-containing protein [Bacteroidales bacterium]|nr:DUF5694 domain-containing protein [Bacteroidales bacterium]
MRKLILLALCLLWAHPHFGQPVDPLPRVPVMTIGTFHFSYPNLDFVQTRPEDQISVLDEPFRSEIIAISKAILEFQPTLIAIEQTSDRQTAIDSLYLLYLADNYQLPTGEEYQLGFRIGRLAGVTGIYCIDDFGSHYDNILELFDDEERSNRLGDHIRKTMQDLSFPMTAPKVSSIIDELVRLNQPENIRNSLASYLYIAFRYEEEPGDYTGVDFESGRWFNRNLRIFRNVQRIPRSPDDRILLITGADHLNLLNILFETSWEFELISPLPYLEKAREML